MLLIFTVFCIVFFCCIRSVFSIQCWLLSISWLPVGLFLTFMFIAITKRQHLVSLLHCRTLTIILSNMAELCAVWTSEFFIGFICGTCCSTLVFFVCLCLFLYFVVTYLSFYAKFYYYLSLLRISIFCLSYCNHINEL